MRRQSAGLTRRVEVLGTTVGVLRVGVLGKRVRGQGLERWVDVLERKGWSVSVRGLKRQVYVLGTS